MEHRNPLVWSDSADKFRPERWLIEDAEQLALMNRHWMPVRFFSSPCQLPLKLFSKAVSNMSSFLIQFGLGSRTCLGRHISMLEICKLIPAIVGDFDFELAGGIADAGTSWHTRNDFFVKPTNFMVKVTLRKT